MPYETSWPSHEKILDEFYLKLQDQLDALGYSRVFSVEKSIFAWELLVNDFEDNYGYRNPFIKIDFVKDDEIYLQYVDFGLGEKIKEATNNYQVHSWDMTKNITNTEALLSGLSNYSIQMRQMMMDFQLPEEDWSLLVALQFVKGTEINPENYREYLGYKFSWESFYYFACNSLTRKEVLLYKDMPLDWVKALRLSNR